MVATLPNCPDDLVQAAWIVVNDSFRTSLCVRFEPRQIAAAAIVHAAQRKVFSSVICLVPDSNGHIFDVSYDGIIKRILSIFDSLYNKEYS